MFYTSKEVANLCNVSTMSVSRWQRAGLITPVFTSKYFNLFDKEQIDLFISKLKTNE
jgi:DNA-binding transcriptional MerR regulator